jgi:hypothetical protein
MLPSSRPIGLNMNEIYPICTVYCKTCPEVFFRQMIAIKITLKISHFSTIFVGTKVSLDVKSEKMCKTRLKILPVLTREHYTSLLHWV